MHGIIGIDFGTTNTLSAWFDGDSVVVIPNERGERVNPTVYAVSDSGEVLTGASARNQALVDPASACLDIKRQLGLKDSVRLAAGERSYIEMAAAVIAKVRRDAEKYLGMEVREAVITVPARFSDPQRRAVRAAAGIAGLKTARILNEPTAAALAKTWSSLKDEQAGHVLVYDFGGGTFDVSLLSMDSNACKVLASEGDERLGGVDIDQLLFRHVATGFAKEFGIELESDPYLVRHVTDLCERAKIELSIREDATVSVPFLRGPAGVAHPKIQLDRAGFEGLIGPLIERSVGLTQKVLKETGVSAEKVDVLILSGGSSRIPLVARRLAECGLKKPDARINPEEVVVIGAAIEAARLQKRLKGFSFTDVCSRSFGLEIEDGSFVPILPKNTPLPARRKREFTTVEDFQSAVEIHVLQTAGSQAAGRSSGDNSSAAAGPAEAVIPVGRFLLSGIRKARKGQPRIEVDFCIDEGDILKVLARDLDTGAEQSVMFFEGGEDTLPPVQRLAWLRERIKAESINLELDSALRQEIEELSVRADLLSREQDRDGALQLLPLLEALLTELTARHHATTPVPR